MVTHGSNVSTTGTWSHYQRSIGRHTCIIDTSRDPISHTLKIRFVDDLGRVYGMILPDDASMATIRYEVDEALRKIRSTLDFQASMLQEHVQMLSGAVVETVFGRRQNPPPRPHVRPAVRDQPEKWWKWFLRLSHKGVFVLVWGR